MNRKELIADRDRWMAVAKDLSRQGSSISRELTAISGHLGSINNTLASGQKKDEPAKPTDPVEYGKFISHGESKVQAKFLVSLAQETHSWSHDFQLVYQCEAVAERIKDRNDREKIVTLLETLLQEFKRLS